MLPAPIARRQPATQQEWRAVVRDITKQCRAEGNRRKQTKIDGAGAEMRWVNGMLTK